MARLVILEKCFKCKQKEMGLCEGMKALKGTKLDNCRGYLDTRSPKDKRSIKYTPFPK